MNSEDDCSASMLCLIHVDPPEVSKKLLTTNQSIIVCIHCLTKYVSSPCILMPVFILPETQPPPSGPQPMLTYHDNPHHLPSPSGQTPRSSTSIRTNGGPSLPTEPRPPSLLWICSRPHWCRRAWRSTWACPPPCPSAARRGSIQIPVKNVRNCLKD